MHWANPVHSSLSPWKISTKNSFVHSQLVFLIIFPIYKNTFRSMRQKVFNIGLQSPSLITSPILRTMSLAERTIGVRDGGRGARQPAGLKIFRANSVFRASECWSKILNDKKYIFNTVNSGHTLFFRASASCSKILNVKRMFNTVKTFRVHSVFQGKGNCPQNPECKTYIQYSIKFLGKLCSSGQAKSCSKILVLNIRFWMVTNIFNAVKNFRAKSIFQGKRKLLTNPERWKIVSSLGDDPCNQGPTWEVPLRGESKSAAPITVSGVTRARGGWIFWRGHAIISS